METSLKIFFFKFENVRIEERKREIDIEIDRRIEGRRER